MYAHSGVKKKCANKSWHHESLWQGSHGLNGSKSSPKMLHWKKKKCMYRYVFKNKKQNAYSAELTRDSRVETCFHQHSFSGSNSSPIHISARLEEKKNNSNTIVSTRITPFGLILGIKTLFLHKGGLCPYQGARGAVQQHCFCPAGALQCAGGDCSAPSVLPILVY